MPVQIPNSLHARLVRHQARLVRQLNSLGVPDGEIVDMLKDVRAGSQQLLEVALAITKSDSRERSEAA